jgi:hypothetical protein
MCIFLTTDPVTAFVSANSHAPLDVGQKKNTDK